MRYGQRRDVTEDEIATFQQDGVVCLRQILDVKLLEDLAPAIEAAMDAPGPLHKDYGAANNTARFFGDYNVWKRLPAFRRFSVDSALPAIVGRLIGSTTVRLYNEHLLVKEPLSLAPTPWHQDYPYFRITGNQIASIWVGLDPVTKDTGAMSFVRGSHRDGTIYRPAQFRSGAAAESGGRFAEVPDIDAHPEDFDLVCYEMAPGDCTVHHGLTLHGSGGNTSPTVRRRAVSNRYTGDDVRWNAEAFSPEETEAAYAQLDREVDLRTGDTLEHKGFPLAYSAG